MKPKYKVAGIVYTLNFLLETKGSLAFVGFLKNLAINQSLG